MKNHLNGMTGETISKQILHCKAKERRQRIRFWGRPNDYVTVEQASLPSVLTVSR
jgi:hypothetical protein